MNCPISYIEEFELKDSLESIDTDTLLIVIDEVVHDLYRDSLKFEEMNKHVILYPVSAGEKLKTFEELQKCLEFFLEKGTHRNCHLVAIGGGTVTDFAGLVASLLLRGLPWTAVPTTLLSMVDAAIGGKVGINSNYGKNLIGDFYLPARVVTCIDFLKSLPECEQISGKGEILKYGLLDKSCFIHIENNRGLKDIIRACADFKNRIVEKDFEEGNARKILNLGHTFGHAYEFLQGVPHGVAVVLGILTVLEIDQRQEVLMKVQTLMSKLQIENVLDSFDYNISAEKIFEVVGRDKKLTAANKIDLITIRDIGYHVIDEMSLEMLKEKFFNYWNSHA